VEKDVKYLLVLSILELKESVTFDLSRAFDSAEAFWKFVGDPMYRCLRNLLPRNVEIAHAIKRSYSIELRKCKGNLMRKFNKIMPKGLFKSILMEATKRKRY
jgi:hypothetical protein